MTEGHGVDHPTLDLPGLLTGELSRDETVALAHHLETCPSCTQELIELLVAHAALRNANRIDRILAPPLDEPVIHPEDADVDTSLGRAIGRRSSPSPGSAEPLPPWRTPLEADDAAIHDGLDGRTHPSRWRRRRRWWAAAAAAAIVLLLAATAVVAVDDHRSSTALVATAALHTIKAPPSTTGAVAVLAQGSTRTLRVAATGLPVPTSHDFYEVWLLDPTTQKMLPMGVLSPAGRGDYSVSATIMAGYSAIDISLQPNNGNPAHSQISMLRAYL